MARLLQGQGHLRRQPLSPPILLSLIPSPNSQCLNAASVDLCHLKSIARIIRSLRFPGTRLRSALDAATTKSNASTNVHGPTAPRHTAPSITSTRMLRCKSMAPSAVQVVGILHSFPYSDRTLHIPYRVQRASEEVASRKERGREPDGDESPSQ